MRPFIMTILLSCSLFSTARAIAEPMPPPPETSAPVIFDAPAAPPAPPAAARRIDQCARENEAPPERPRSLSQLDADAKHSRRMFAAGVGLLAGSVVFGVLGGVFLDQSRRAAAASRQQDADCLSRGAWLCGLDNAILEGVYANLSYALFGVGAAHLIPGVPLLVLGKRGLASSGERPLAWLPSAERSVAATPALLSVGFSLP